MDWGVAASESPGPLCALSSQAAVSIRVEVLERLFKPQGVPAKAKAGTRQRKTVRASWMVLVVMMCNPLRGQCSGRALDDTPGRWIWINLLPPTWPETYPYQPPRGVVESLSPRTVSTAWWWINVSCAGWFDKQSRASRWWAAASMRRATVCSTGLGGSRSTEACVSGFGAGLAC